MQGPYQRFDILINTINMLCYLMQFLVVTIALPVLGIIAYGLYNVWTSEQCKSRRRLDGRVVVVTGGSAGIGLRIAAQLARRGARVIITCPFIDEGAAARDSITKETDNLDVIFKRLDLASLESVQGFAKDLIRHENRLDVLINNAGVLMPDQLTEDGMNYVMQVNYFGHFLLTFLLLPLLMKSGAPSDRNRVINVSSMSYRHGEINIDGLNATGLGLKAYANSKLCVTMMSLYLADKLKGANANVVVNVADPGMVGGTNITNSFGAPAKIVNVLMSRFYPGPSDGAQTAIFLALDEKAGELNGQYFLNCTLSRVAYKAMDQVLAQKLWDKTIKLLKLNESDLRLNRYSKLE